MVGVTHVSGQYINHLCTPVPDNCSNGTLSVTGVTNLCIGSTYTFTPTATLPVEDSSVEVGNSVSFNAAAFVMVNYSWTPTGVTPSSGTVNPSSTVFSVGAPAPGATTIYTLSVTSLGPNILNRGDFTQCDTGCLQYDCMASLYNTACGSAGDDPGHIKMGYSWGFNDEACPDFASVDSPYVGCAGSLDVNGALCNCPDATHGLPGAPAFGYDYPYFWGQAVNGCTARYHFSYWARLWNPCSSCSVGNDVRPLINVVIGDDGAGDLINGGNPGYTVDTQRIGPLSGCGGWQEYSFDFTAGAFSFICMTNTEYGGAKFAIDNIRLERYATITTELTVKTIDTPSASITAAATACLNKPFTFTIHGSSGDIVYYNITRPGGATIDSSGTISGGILPVTTPSLTATGTVCLNITGMKEPCHSGIDSFGIFPVITDCIPIITVPSGGAIRGDTAIECSSNPNFTIYDTTATGATGYKWNYSGTGAAVTGSGDSAEVHLTGTGIFTVTCSDTNVCGTGVPVSHTFTVNPSPAKPNITGPLSVCVGATATATVVAVGGFSDVWSTDNPGVLTVGSSSGIVTGVAVGTAHLIYTMTGVGPTYCSSADTVLVTVLPLPAKPHISGDTNICPGATTTITATYSGTATATYNWSPAGSCTTCDSDVITPTTSPSIYSVTVTSGGCTSPATTFTVTFNPVPSPPVVAGSFSVCPNSTTTLTATSSSGSTYVWGPPSPTLSCDTCNPVAITPSVSGTITDSVYSISALGCKGAATTFAVTGLPAPKIAAIDSPSVCPTFAAVLTATVTGATGYSWVGTGVSSSSLTVTFTPTVTGHVYTLTATDDTDGCTTKRTTVVTILPLPGPPVFNPPHSTICKGDTTEVGASSSYADSASWVSYTWEEPTATLSCTTCSTTETYPSVTTVYTVYATALTCVGSPAYDTVTVKPAVPIISSIGEDTGVCTGTTVTFSLHAAISGDSTFNWSGPSGYTSTLLDPAPITITPTVTSVYVLTVIDTGQCETEGTVTITVHPFPVVSHIIAIPDTICIGDSTHFRDDTAGGVWSSGIPTIATVDDSGYVTGVSAGKTKIFYEVTSIYGCSTTDTDSVTVHVLTNPGVITGPDSLCRQTYGSLFDSVSGGVWSSSDSSVLSVNSSGNIFGVTEDTAIIYYTVPAGFCPAASATDTIRVVTTPVVKPITGIDSVCVMGTITLSDSTTGGTWFSYNTGIADVNPTTGVVTGVAGGTAVIAYDKNNACGTTEVTDTIRVLFGKSPITGYTGVCSGNTTLLSNITSGGTWSSSNPAVASINASTGLLTGIATGTATITYISTNSCGTFTVTTKVGVNEPLYITTRSILACESLTGSDNPNNLPYILPDSGCVQVCDSTLMRYYANNNASASIIWAVTGGTIVNNYGDSIDVFWPAAGTTGSISLSDSIDICSGSASVCITVIQKPDAGFTVFSSLACLNSPVSFINTSTADSLSPIVSYYWNFADGSSSAEVSPTHTFSFAGTFPVTLVVKNACGCSDTFETTISVINAAGASISCTSVLCDSQSATYDVTGSGCYTWSVTGGTITNTGATSVTVDWNDVPASGFGYVSVVNNCSGCPGATSIQVPVILANAAINGPDVICTGEEYEYQLPLWPATQYMWGVPGDPGAIAGFRNDYKVVVDFSAPGTFTIHGWYQNVIGLCGGNVDKTITVEPAAMIIGPATICTGTGAGYNISSGASGSWTLSSVATGSVVATGTGSTFSYPFPTAGTYMLTATGSFCANPVTITVSSVPAVDSVSGPDTVCLGRVYNYTAYSDIAGTEYVWSATGGTIEGPATGSAVSVIWTGGTMKLNVYRQNILPPYCESAPTIINIGKTVVALNISGDTLPCANSYRTYATTYTQGEVYSWAVIPDTAGSVMSGNYGTTPEILWNNTTVPVNALIVLTVTKCDTNYTDTLHVHVQTAVNVTLTTPHDSVCGGGSVTFYASPGGSTYYWSVGGGASVSSTSDDKTLFFNYNNTSITYPDTIKVTALPSTSYACPVSGTATFVEYIKTTPGVSIYSSYTHLCYYPATSATCTESGYDSIISLKWYIDTGTASIGTGLYFAPMGSGTYWVVAEGVNGCSVQSNSLVIDTNCTYYNGTDTLCNSSIAAGITVSDSILDCDTVLLKGTYLASPNLDFWTTGNGTTVPGSEVGSYWEATTTTNAPQNTVFYYNAFYSSMRCRVVDTMWVDIGAKIGFTASIGCGDVVTVTDHTLLGSGWTVSGTGVSFSTPLSGTGGVGLSESGTLSSGTYLETETVTYAHDTLPSHTCAVTDSIKVPVFPIVSAAFTASSTDICAGVPVTFTPTSPAGITSYFWNFRDNSSSLLDTTQRTYTYNPGLGNPNPYYVTLTVTDSLGCSFEDSVLVDIQEDQMSGSFGLIATTVCSSAAPVTLSYAPESGTPSAISYLWSTGAITPTISVDTTGAYWVTVTGPYLCPSTTTPQNIKIIKIPSAYIAGPLSYCVGTASAILFNYSGSVVSYEWYFNGAYDGTTPTINVGGMAAGDYPVELIISMTDTASSTTCTDSLKDSVYVHPLPAMPVITGPVAVNCGTYELALTATDSATGFFNWSDGNTGSVDDVYSGGAYQVTFTNMNGCQDTASIIVPQNPGMYFAYFPSGCYDICSGQLPLTLYGPPNEDFHPWRWMHNGSLADSGSGIMPSYAVTVSGTYSWGLSNSLCPVVFSPTMNVTAESCTNCSSDSIKATLTCTSGNEASYAMTIVLTSPAGGTKFVLGTSVGPVVPFSGTLPGTSTYTLSLTYTTLEVPPPTNVEVEVNYTLPSGAQCFQEEKIAVPSCTWTEERTTGNDSEAANNSAIQQIASALLVYPNPATGMVIISYNYGSSGNSGRSIDIYDETGNKRQSTAPPDGQGTWQLNTAGWIPGVYIIRMAGDGQTLQTQRLVVTN